MRKSKKRGKSKNFAGRKKEWWMSGEEMRKCENGR